VQAGRRAHQLQADAIEALALDPGQHFCHLHALAGFDLLGAPKALRTQAHDTGALPASRSWQRGDPCVTRGVDAGVPPRL
jgi:hypothetical protein